MHARERESAEERERTEGREGEETEREREEREDFEQKTLLLLIECFYCDYAPKYLIEIIELDARKSPDISMDWYVCARSCARTV